jgi:hypothetical protein
VIARDFTTHHPLLLVFYQGLGDTFLYGERRAKWLPAFRDLFGDTFREIVGVLCFHNLVVVDLHDRCSLSKPSKNTTILLLLESIGRSARLRRFAVVLAPIFHPVAFGFVPHHQEASAPSGQRASSHLLGEADVPFRYLSAEFFLNPDKFPHVPPEEIRSVPISGLGSSGLDELTYYYQAERLPLTHSRSASDSSLATTVSGWNILP